LNTHRAQVDLVLSDVVMPDVDGLSLAQTIRSSGGTTPIVFMSGYAGHGQEVEAQLARIGPTLVKPFSHEGLTTTVRRVLDRSPRTRSVPGRYQPL
ncbi:MAG: response regulator, partial [Gemmatimonadetes bacterium]|nr:response regulator [Gemmatimonadota bacterium]